MAFRARFTLSLSRCCASILGNLLLPRCCASILGILLKLLVGFQVYALTGGLAPLMPAIDVAQLKRRIQSENEKVGDPRISCVAIHTIFLIGKLYYSYMFEL